MARLEEIVRGGQMPCSLLRVAPGARTHLFYALTRMGRTVFVVSATDYDAKQQFDRCYYGNKVYLPSAHVELRLVEAKSGEAAAERVAALAQLREKGRLVFLSMDALLYKMRAPEPFYDKFLTLRSEMVIPPQKLMEKLIGLGYERTALVETPGFCSGRGEILEVYPPDAPHPYRITFFDDEIETIRFFDEDSQRSFGDSLSDITVPPAGEICLSEEEKQELCGYLKRTSGEKREEAGARMAYDLRENGSFPNIEAYTGVFQKTWNILDYAGESLVVFQEYHRLAADQEKREEARASLFSEVMEQEDAFGCEIACRLSPEEFLDAFAGRALDVPGLSEEKRLKKHTVDFAMKSAVGFMGNMEMLADSLLLRIKEGYRCYLFSGGKTKALSEGLKEYGVLAPALSGKALEAPGAAVVPARLTEGFEIAETKTLYLSEEEIFGAPVKGREKRQKKKENRAPEDLLGDLKPGDIVVHEIHGKGKFLGLRNMEVGGARADYIELEYRGGDKLYIQTAQIDRVQKYIGPGEAESVRLNKLGGKEWENTKAKAASSIKELAEDLVALYRERGTRRGYHFSRDTVWQRQFEDSFAYEETPGQTESIAQIKRDMESGKIMDRLLLGDVGYGKTEVAMRACFKAVMDSKQVAVLVPTTLLARQHYETFKERFAGFPVRIGLLSRYSKNPADTIRAVNEGRIDIIIGTHKLLSKQIHYKDLGLLVVDEEQRFGVSHKERIKDMKKEVDVLTLTATPIPRTLEMAMTGIREMSTIATPPGERKEVQAYVAPFSWGLVREAILKELQRGGQVYFVTRRITGMEEIARQLKAFVPEARVVTAHGQMSETVFEKNVEDFYEHQYDVLLCTTIIESGIDIPSVNTIIVYEADKFGLSQLYQLKGRVGRSSIRAYAYFTHMAERNLNEAAAKRLEAIREFTQFGSGFKIAMRDLEIRGAGNILGAEQSGHMAQIGYTLYCKLVKEQVRAAMGDAPAAQTESNVELGVNAYIPGSYIPEEEQKLDMYRRIEAIQTMDDARAVRDEFYDRFGTAPNEVESLLGAAVVRAYAARAHIASVIRKGNVIELRFPEDAPIDPGKLLEILQNYQKTAQFRAGSPPRILFKPGKGKIYSGLLGLMEQIRRCISGANPV